MEALQRLIQLALRGRWVLTGFCAWFAVGCQGEATAPGPHLNLGGHYAGSWNLAVYEPHPGSGDRFLGKATCPTTLDIHMTSERGFVGSFKNELGEACGSFQQERPVVFTVGGAGTIQGSLGDVHYGSGRGELVIGSGDRAALESLLGCQLLVPERPRFAVWAFYPETAWTMRIDINTPVNGQGGIEFLTLLCGAKEVYVNLYLTAFRD